MEEFSIFPNVCLNETSLCAAVTGHLTSTNPFLCMFLFSRVTDDQTRRPGLITVKILKGYNVSWCGIHMLTASCMHSCDGSLGASEQTKFSSLAFRYVCKESQTGVLFAAESFSHSDKLGGSNESCMYTCFSLFYHSVLWAFFGDKLKCADTQEKSL